MYPAPLFGSVSRPSPKKWMKTFGTSISFARLSRAYRCWFLLWTPPSLIKPSRCSLPLPSMARWKLFVTFSTLSISPLLIVKSMRTTSCHTTRPAPMFRCPTSELPIRPSGRPTALEEASSSVYPCAVLEPSALKSSITGVSAAAIASPSLGEVSEGIPQPSMTTAQTSVELQRRGGGNYSRRLCGRARPFLRMTTSGYFAQRGLISEDSCDGS